MRWVQVTRTEVTSAPLTVPVAPWRVHSCSAGEAARATVYVLPSSISVWKVKAPSAVRARFSAPLSCRVRLPERPVTEPPTL